MAFAGAQKLKTVIKQNKCNVPFNEAQKWLQVQDAQSDKSCYLLI